MLMLLADQRSSTTTTIPALEGRKVKDFPSETLLPPEGSESSLESAHNVVLFSQNFINTKVQYS